MAAWEASLPANLVTDGNSYVGNCFNDSQFTENLAISGQTTDATHTILLTAASGQSICDNSANALYFDKTKGVSNTCTDNSGCNIASSNCTVSRIQWEAKSSAYNRGGLSSGAGLSNAKYLQCIATYNGAGSAVNTRAIILDTCLVISLSTHATGGTGISLSRGSTAESCTVVMPSDQTNTGSTGIAASNYAGTPTLKNCASFGYATGTSTSGAATWSFIATDGTSPGGTGSVGGLTYSSQFNSTSTAASPDFKLQSGSSLKDAGSTSLGVDFFGTSIPQGSAADIGCFELVASAAASVPYNPWPQAAPILAQ